VGAKASIRAGGKLGWVLRLVVRRFGRLPTALVEIERGAELRLTREQTLPAMCISLSAAETIPRSSANSTIAELMNARSNASRNPHIGWQISNARNGPIDIRQT
jgi:hypothetical protein